jgi:hypothetical protein
MNVNMNVTLDIDVDGATSETVDTPAMRCPRNLRVDQGAAAIAAVDPMRRMIGERRGTRGVALPTKLLSVVMSKVVLTFTVEVNVNATSAARHGAEMT